MFATSRQESAVTMGRIIAIDYGTRRVGVAVTDPDRNGLKDRGYLSLLLLLGQTNSFT